VRQLISNFARIYLSVALGVNIKDLTSGYRMFSRDALEKILPKLGARDPFIVSEVLYFLKETGAKIIEVPIEFMPRGTGESKLKPATLAKYLLRVLQLRLTGKSA
jgi:dolichol-phosphate mannosyltransferase